MGKLIVAGAIIGVSVAITRMADAQTAAAPIVQPPAMQQRVIANDGASTNSNNNYQVRILPGPLPGPNLGGGSSSDRQR
jgi:hypothetical protein